MKCPMCGTELIKTVDEKRYIVYFCPEDDYYEETEKTEEYTNEESKKITKLLNEARKECGLEDFLPEVEVRFIKPINSKKVTGDQE